VPPQAARPRQHLFSKGFSLRFRASFLVRIGASLELSTGLTDETAPPSPLEVERGEGGRVCGDCLHQLAEALGSDGRRLERQRTQPHAQPRQKLRQQRHRRLVWQAPEALVQGRHWMRCSVGGFEFVAALVLPHVKVTVKRFGQKIRASKCP